MKKYILVAIVLLFLFLFLFGCKETVNSEKEMEKSVVGNEENNTITVPLVRPPFLDKLEGG